MKVTLDVFSGRPNPSWVLPDKEAKSLADRFAGRALPAVHTAPPVLGFRGYVVSAESDDEMPRAVLPDRFRIGGGLPAEFTARAGLAAVPVADEESDDAALWLLSTAQGAVDDEVLAFVENSVKQHTSPAPAKSTRLRKSHVLAAPAGCIISDTLFNPAFWNQPAVQPFNNCYNYAMNFVSNTVAQPGRISGHQYTALTSADVGAAADLDGCRETCKGPAKQVALVIWPGVDSHWFRKHANGFWGHKVGIGVAVNLDGQNRVIGGNLTPENCDRGPYTEFSGYRFSPVGMHVV